MERTCCREPVDEVQQAASDARCAVTLRAQRQSRTQVVFDDAQQIRAIRATLTPDLGEAVTQSG